MVCLTADYPACLLPTYSKRDSMKKIFGFYPDIDFYGLSQSISAVPFLMSRKVLLTTLFLLLPGISMTVCADDNGINSPFSRYGMGLLSKQGQGFNTGMAGLAYGMRDGRELNFKNPASYTAIDSLSFLFDAGITLQNGNFDAGKVSSNIKDATFDYVAMGFRINKYLGMSLGVMPFSNVGYEIATAGDIFDAGTMGEIYPTNSYSGSGGTHQLYGGVGFAPVRPLSIGVNVSYFWGVMEHYAINSYSDSQTQSLSRGYTTNIRTYKLDFGLQYQQPLGKAHSLTLGAVYGLGHDISSDSYFINQRLSGSTVLAGDTLVAKKAWSIPHTFGVGLTWTYKRHLRIGVDYAFEKWSSATMPTLTQNQQGALVYAPSSADYTDCQKITAGVEYVPAPDGLRWRNRIRYRAGFSYSDSYTKIRGGNGPKTYLATVGVSLPIINAHSNRSFLNAALQFERVNPSVAGQLKETYLKLSLGVSFNERWFMKWKVK